MFPFENHYFASTAKRDAAPPSLNKQSIRKAKGIRCFCKDGSGHGDVISIPARSVHHKAAFAESLVCPSIHE